MTMKKMKNFIALLLALVMTMSLVACGNKTSEETKTGEEIGCYVQTTETGEKVLVDKDGKAVTDFTLDADGNVLDADGNVVVKAEDTMGLWRASASYLFHISNLAKYCIRVKVGWLVNLQNF